MAKPVGGRGIKAPYETTVVRIPVALKNQVEQMTQAYRDGTLDQTSESISIDEVIELAREVLKQKKSAKKSLEAFIEKLYKSSVQL